ncbi:hybrid non-ribosomal peptide synthetase/type I polyketide synthase [Salinivibrio sp. SS2]|uniref:hybrid non-ribosomal peptide synthetase/type I polyketide synthase n=1 Tax=Salinivibrio sp. SS2 TaxID=1892894 RepID=UPI00084C2D30|nr:hybrid non-ribosomal peptide synthetase/type I polyketide synthase [Salinivibrio sp. DV]ODP98165.1 non-ribosomal peptide synthetase [Salinivibrio sp. DV]
MDNNNLYDNCDPIAVIGMACRFPKAPNIDAFWHNLSNGLSGQSFFSDEELQAAGVDADVRQCEHFIPSGAVIDNPEYFDASLFGYSPAEATSIDPQQRLFLQNVWHALEHAGYAPTQAPSKTGVFGAVRSSTYPSFKAFDVTQVGQVKGLQALLGNDKDYLATRVAHKFNFTGPAFTVQTACSSSLVAAHLACESLRSGECDMAIAGGVAVSFPQVSGYEYQPGMIFSPDGLCRPFDQQANGTFGGHGVGSVVLKRLDDALNAGDTVLAVLRGSAINNDGKEKVGFTAPSVNGQSQVLSEALHLADIHPDDVEMIEAHGTGTKLGDPIEVTAIKSAYQRSSDAPMCRLGSVKSGLGHLDTAAGIASLIKAVLSVSRQKIPMSLNISQPNPELQLEGSGFTLATQTVDWLTPLRTAAVSSFGMGGTNCHMLVQSSPQQTRPEQPVTKERTDIPLLLSANSSKSLRQLAQSYSSYLNQHPAADNIAYSALSSRALDLPYRLAVTNVAHAESTLSAFAQSGEASSELVTGIAQSRARLAWTFTGQGSQFGGMGETWYHTSDAFRQSIDLSQSYCRDKLTAPLTEIMFGSSRDKLAHTDGTQVAIVAFELALAAHWQAKGLTPDVVLGHSVGEVSACVVAGYLSHQQAIELVIERGQQMHQCAQQHNGAMLAVFAPLEQLNGIPALAKLDRAAHNGTAHWVFSGDIQDIEHACHELEQANLTYRQLEVPCAAHSRHLDSMLDSYTNFTRQLTPTQGRITLISGVTGKTINSVNELSPDYWARHVRESVQFRPAIEQALALECQVFMEMGPKPHLTSIGRREQWTSPCAWLHAEEDNIGCALYTLGVDAPWKQVFNLTGQRCDLPLYVFDEQAYWVETEQPIKAPQLAESESAIIPPVDPMTLRCAVIQDFLRSCVKQAPLSLINILRGGRILPRHRHHIRALLDLLVTQGYYHKQGDVWLPSQSLLLPSADVVTQRWLAETSADDKASVEQYCQQLLSLSPQLPNLLRQLNHVATIEAQLAPLLTGQSFESAPTQSNSSWQDVHANLSYQDWSSLSEQQDLPTAIHHKCSQLLPISPNVDLSVSDTYPVKELSRVAICRLNKMWGQDIYDLRAQAPQGHWQWLARIQPQTANNDDSPELLPSPHNRYQWQATPVESDRQVNLVTAEQVTLACTSTGTVHQITPEQGLIVLPATSLSEANTSETITQLAHTLSHSPDHLWIVVCGAMKVSANDDIAPLATALHSLIRVARSEYPNKQFFVLDTKVSQPQQIAEILAAAPFSCHHDLAYRDGQYWAYQLKHAQTHDDSIPPRWFNAQSAHLITGAMGGIGRLVIRWLALSGVKHILALGRQQHADWTEFCRQMAEIGCHIETHIVDLAVDGELTRLLEQIAGKQPIAGAIHAAGNPHHGLIEQWDSCEAERLTRVKAQSFVTLYQWLEAQRANYLIGFSSVATLGAPGQGLYAAANGFIDGFAQSHQANKQCHVMSLAWGAWDRIGMTSSDSLIAQLGQQGMYTISPAEGLWHLSQSLLMGAEHAFAMNVSPNSAQFAKHFRLASQSSNKPSTQPLPVEKIEISSWLQDRVRYQLGLAKNYRLEPQQDLLQLGMDSLQFLDLNAAIQKQFNIKLTAEEAYQTMTVHGLEALINAKSQDAKPQSTLTFAVQPDQKHLPFPLTPIQHAYWVGRESWVPYGGIACNVVFEWDLSHAHFDIERLEAAWNALVQRHDMLRMSVLPTGEQIISAEVPNYSFTRHDLSDLTDDAKANALEETRQTISKQVRPASQWPLFEVRISELTPCEYRLHMSLDLLQFDVQSFKIMMDDLNRAYQGEALPTLPLSFRDYVVHEQALKDQPEWQASWNYWLNLIPSIPKAPMLPLENVADSHTPTFVTRKGRLTKPHWTKLKAHWLQAGITPSAGLLTLFSRLLAKWSQSAAFTLNMTFFNRQPFHHDVQDLIGDFTSVLLMDFDWSQDLDLTQQMSRTQETLWTRLSHSQVNGVEVMRELAKYRKSQNQLTEQEAALPMTPVVFTSMLGMSMDGKDIEKAMTHLFGDPVYVLSQTPQVWLDHQIMEVDGELKYHWYCMDGVIALDVIDEMFAQYAQWLDEIAQAPDNFQRNLLISVVEPTSYAATLPEITPAVEKEVTSAWSYLEHQALAGLWATLRQHQLFTQPEQRFSHSHVVQALSAAPKHHKLVQLWLDQLVREGLLQVENNLYAWHGNELVAPLVELPNKNWCQQLSHYLATSLQAHSELLSDHMSALEILFKDHHVTDALYKTNPSLTLLNQGLANLITRLGEQKEAALKVLEVGAGTAATSTVILDHSASHIEHYRFTDISHAFLNEAKQSLAKYSQVDFGWLDINLDIEPELHLVDGYDVIVAVNVLHDASDLPKTLARLKQALAANGHLLLIEATDQYSPMQLATVGFIEGINAFSDFRCQTGSAMLNATDWQSLLKQQGFATQCRYPNSDSSVLRQHLFLAQANSSQALVAKPSPSLSVENDEVHATTAALKCMPKQDQRLSHITQIWSSILQQEVNLDTDFFQSGGDSLMATKMIVEVNKQQPDQVSLQQIFEHPTLKQFCQALAESCEAKPCDEATEPQDEISEIEHIWQQLLDQTINPDTDFFQSGGDSLMATKLIVQLQQVGFESVTLQHIFEHPVFANFCQQLSKQDIDSTNQQHEASRDYPLTPLQNAYWLGESRLFSLGQGIAHFYAELEIKDLDYAALVDGWNRLVSHHDQLRGEIREGRYCILQQVPHYEPSYVDLSSSSESDTTRYLTQARNRIATQGVSTDRWPLFDINIIRIDEETHLLHLVIDLVVADGKSLNLLFQQWQQLYQDPATHLDTPAITVAQYLENKAAQSVGEDGLAAQQYWNQRLPSLPDAPALPLAETRGDVLDQGVFTHRLSAERWNQLQHQAFSHNVLPSMAMLATFCLVLRRWSETKHFSLNVLHGNRPASSPEIANLVGNFSTTSMLEVDVCEEPALLTLIQQIQQRMSDDLAHVQFDGQDVLTEKNRLNRNFSAGMPIVFNDTTSVGQHSSLTLGTLRDFGAQTPHVYLDAMLISSACGGVDIKWTVQHDHLKAGVFDAMFHAYINAVESLPTRNWLDVLCLNLPKTQQKRQQHTHIVQTKASPHSTPQTLLDMIAEGVDRYPDNIAIQQGELLLTYQDVWHASKVLASQIVEQNDDSRLVAVVMDKSWQQVVAVMAILMAGKAYLPIDATYPQARIDALLEQGEVTQVIAPKELAKQLKPYHVLTPSLNQQDVATFQPLTLHPTDLAYVIFTSGSTGQPKGVMMDHQAVINTLVDIEARLNLNEQDKVLAISALNFDLSVFDLFSTLHCGACLVIPEISPAQDPDGLITLAEQAQITIWNSVPAFAQLLTDGLNSRNTALPSLRNIMMSGDWIPVSLPDQLNLVAPNAKLLSLGGATEAAIWSIAYPIKGSYVHRSSIPYGQPLTNQSFFVLDSELNPCPDWITGELYIGGLGLSLGYWQDEAKTAAAFITHPQSGERLYKTGDLGRYQSDGNIEFLGRNDHQVKINGYRIELGEVENTLRHCPISGLEERLQSVIAAPITVEDGSARLVAYTVCSQRQAQDTEQLLQYARQTLPTYMCPVQIVPLDSIPLTINGKVDRKALPAPKIEISVDARPPLTSTEQQIAQIWDDCLQQSATPANQSFFELGGNSLAAVRVISRINTELGAQLTVGQLQSHDTIERLASILEQQFGDEGSSPVLLTSAEHQHPALFIVHPIGGHLLSYQPLAQHLSQVSLYGLAFPNMETDQESWDVQQLAQYYIEQIRDIQPHGPYRLAGWSFGGIVAYEMAYQLTQQSLEVEACILIDSYKPTTRKEAMSAQEIRHHFYADVIGRFPQLTQADTPDLSTDSSLCTHLSAAFSQIVAIGDVTTDSVQRLLDIYRHNLSAMLSYVVPNLHSVPTTLIAASHNNHLDFMSYQDPKIARCTHHGWKDYCDLTLHHVSGDHYTLLQEPHVNQLANTLGSLLQFAPKQDWSSQPSTTETLENE